MAGLEPARANYGPTDFKSVASTIPPHRRCGVHCKLLIRPAKMDFATSTRIQRENSLPSRRKKHLWACTRHEGGRRQKARVLKQADL